VGEGFIKVNVLTNLSFVVIFKVNLGQRR